MEKDGHKLHWLQNFRRMAPKQGIDYQVNPKHAKVPNFFGLAAGFQCPVSHGVRKLYSTENLALGYR